MRNLYFIVSVLLAYLLILIPERMIFRLPKVYFKPSFFSRLTLPPLQTRQIRRGEEDNRVKILKQTPVSGY